jgi:serine protein kinase
MSPWCIKRLDEFNCDISRFRVQKLTPSRLRQIAVAKTEPGDENNQDISSLVGKVDIRKLELHAQNDPDAYSYSGGLNRANQGILEFVEMFKAPIKMLHPLLTATQESNYIGTENIGAVPFSGIILAHSNEAEWQSFRNNRNNEAFVDRIYVIKVPYCLRVTEEQKIYEKLIAGSELYKAPYAPATLEMLARFSVLSRLKRHENSTLYSKMRVYDGESLKETDPRARSLQEYKDVAGVEEGMDGASTRFAYKVLAATFNHDTTEIAADPVHLMYVLEQAIRRDQMAQETEKRYLELIKSELAPRYVEFIGNEIQKAYLESYSDYGQNLFDRYVAYADAWIEDSDYKDPDTGQLMNRELLNQELSKIEKPAGIANPKDFRNEVVKFALRARANNAGRNPSWTSYEKLREVIERRMFSQVEDLLPVISFGSKKDTETEKKHADFLDRMVARGYTERQVRRLVEWYMRVNKAG